VGDRGGFGGDGVKIAQSLCFSLIMPNNSIIMLYNIYMLYNGYNNSIIKC